MGMPRLVPRLLKGPFTVGDYHRMAETGVLRQDARVELLDGQVVEMSPIALRPSLFALRAPWPGDGRVLPPQRQLPTFGQSYDQLSRA